MAPRSHATGRSAYANLLGICLWSISLSCGALAREADSQTVIFGIYPLLSTPLLVHRMQPLADYLRSTGIDGARIKVDQSYEEFIENSRRGEYDLVQAPAQTAAYLIERGDYRPAIIWNSTFSSVILTKTDSPLKSVSDLKDRLIYRRV